VLLARCDHDQQEAPRAITREIAEILKDLEGSNAASSAIALLASRLACIFKDDDPAFDRENPRTIELVRGFLRKCYPQNGEQE
jgi:hypothetical protein